MPIKFRCQQCRQFLGISRVRAGEIVDCPTCGRTIRVPELDGTVRPLPEPGLKYDDSRLKSALDEIALIGDEPSRNPEVDANSDSAPPDSQHASPEDAEARPGMATLDEPDALPPLRTAEPIAVGPLPERAIDCSAIAGDEGLSSELESKEQSEEARPWRSTAQPRDSWKQLIAEAAVKEQQDEDEVRRLADDSLNGEQGLNGEHGTGAAHRSVDGLAGENSGSDGQPALPVETGRESVVPGFSTWFAIVGLIVLICSAGFWIGRSTAITWSIDPSVPENQLSSSGVVADSEVVERSRAGLEGRITWKSEAGEWRPDRDACVIVLPVDREGISRVSFVGLRRGDSAEDREMVKSSLRAMGGAVSFADSSGHFQTTLDEPGEYYVLILSRSAGRAADLQDQETLDTLGRYFDRAEQLLGRLAYRFEKLRCRAQTMTPLDAGFEARQ